MYKTVLYINTEKTVRAGAAHNLNNTFEMVTTGMSKDASFLHTTILTMCTAKKVSLKL
jgi:hypothetical protein